MLALPHAALQSANSRVGVDGSLNAAVVYSGTIDFGGGPLQGLGTNSLAIARFDTTGNHAFSQSFGAVGSSFGIGSLGVNTAGRMVVTSRSAGKVDSGGGPLSASDDTFLAVFDSAGHLTWAKTVTAGAQGGLIATAGKCGLVLATHRSSVDLGRGPLSVMQPGLPASIGVAALGF